MKVKGKTIVVTGGASGIGRALVLNLLSKGASVAAVDLNPTTLQETADLAGVSSDRLSTYVVNVTDQEAVFALPNQVVANHGAVDGIVNNAGIIQPFVMVNELDLDDIERVINVNLWGQIYMIKAFLPHLLARPEAHIANVSSMGGYLPVPGQTIYGASKAAVKLLTEGLHSELMETNVGVTVIYPGAVGTNIAANSGVVIGANMEQSETAARVLPAEKAADIIVDAIETDRYRVLVGSDARLMDTLVRLAPKFAARFIHNQMKQLLAR